jgi:zinc transporter ZupT
MPELPSAFLVILLGLLAGGSNLIGGGLALLRPIAAERAVLLGLAFSGGFLLAVALLHVLPECARLTPHWPAWLLLGYGLVYLAEHAFAGHAHLPAHAPHGAHPLVGVHLDEPAQAPIAAGAASAAALGLLLHSGFDGAAIAAALSAKAAVGWLTFLAVVLHKVPEGFSLATIALSSGGTRRSALLLSGGLGVSSLAGTLLTLGAVRAFLSVEGPVLSVACGMFVHIAATDLLPTTAHVRGLGVMVATLAGVATVAATGGLLHAALP